MLDRWKGALLLGVSLSLSAPACFFSDSCFVRGTRVWTPRGRRPIEDLEVGDEVLSFDLASRRLVTRRVARLVRARAAEVFRVEAGEHAIAGVTAEHPFYDAAAGAYLRVDELTVRSRFLVMVGDGEITARPLSTLSRVPSKGEVEVFNLSIEGDEQNYFAEGVLVHNKTPPYESDPEEGSDGDDDGWNDDEDCDDNDPNIHPDAEEDCTDTLDNDCDGAISGEDVDCGGTSGTQRGS